MRALTLISAAGFFGLVSAGIGIGVAGQSEGSSWTALAFILAGLVCVPLAHLASKSSRARARR